MSLGDELFALRNQRSTSRIDPVEYYESLARLLDVSPDGVPNQFETILTCIRRIEALLEDRLGARGVDLDRKIESTSDRIPPDLRSELRSIAGLRKAMSHGDILNRAENGALQSKCENALFKTLRLAETVSPPDPSIRIKAFLPTWARRGVVRNVRQSQRPLLPSGRGVEYLALADIDGRLVVITSGLPLQIERDDWVVVAGRADHEAVLYYNESRPSGKRRKRYQTTGWALTGLGALATLAGGAMVYLALIRAAPSHWDIPLIGRCAALVLAGVLTSWIGIWFSTMMVQMTRLARAFDEVLKLPARQNR